MIDFMCFLFDFDFIKILFDFVKNLLTNEVFIGYVGIAIEAIFLFFVLKEFKMTRKSFEWQKEEETAKILKEIIIILREKCVEVGKMCFYEKNTNNINDNEYYFKQIVENFVIQNFDKNEKDTLKKIFYKYVDIGSINMLLSRLFTCYHGRDEENLQRIDTQLNHYTYKDIKILKQSFKNFDYKIIENLYLKLTSFNIDFEIVW